MSGAGDGRMYFTVIEYIKRQIGDGKLRFGEKLPSERELMETLGVSRTSIREALRTLEHMGLLESSQGKGTFLVNRMGESLSSVFSMLLLTGESSYEEVSQVRRGLETEAFSLAAKRMGEAELAQLTELLKRMEAADKKERAAIDLQFHGAIAKSSGNLLFSVLLQAMEGLCRSEIERVQSALSGQEAERLMTLHWEILRGIREKDISGGIAAIREHYEMTDRAAAPKG